MSRHSLPAPRGPAGPAGPQGDPGPPGSGGGSGGGVEYVHTQSTPALTWTINHNLGTYPSVLVLDANHRRIIPSLDYPSPNQTVISHTSPYAGTAYLRA